MEFFRTPSAQSLVDSDLESVETLNCLDIEEFEEAEYALPPSEEPTLDEASSTTAEVDDKEAPQSASEPSTCSPLEAELLHCVSEQIIEQQEVSWTGATTSLCVGPEGKITVGTAHGVVLSFSELFLRWVCNLNVGRGAVSCLAYNRDYTRLLAGFARGLVCQLETERGTILRRIALGNDLWGMLKVTWADTSGLALDVSGSVWMIKFLRIMGVRSAQTSCLFPRTRGEVVAVAARDARNVALATLSRVIVVAGNRAASMRLGGPPDILPVLQWAEAEELILVCARAKTLDWLSLDITGSSISFRPIQRVELKCTPVWLGWISGILAIIDTDENLRLWGDDYDEPLKLSPMELVYTSTFFQGHWSSGRISRGMYTAGVSGLGGACALGDILFLLSQQGIVCVKIRDVLTRAEALMSHGRHLQALELLCSTEGLDATELARQFVTSLSERPQVLSNKQMADQTVKMCLKFNLRDELWGILWDQCWNEKAFVEALGDAEVRGELDRPIPAPGSTQVSDFTPKHI